MARRYDSSTTTFSPEGRLHQVRLLSGKIMAVPVLLPALSLTLSILLTAVCDI